MHRGGAKHGGVTEMSLAWLAARLARLRAAPLGAGELRGQGPGGAPLAGGRAVLPARLQHRRRITALPLAWLLYAIPGEPLWRWSGRGAWLANGLALAAVAGFFVSTRAYDMDEFLGLRQMPRARPRHRRARRLRPVLLPPLCPPPLVLLRPGDRVDARHERGRCWSRPSRSRSTSPSAHGSRSAS